MRDYRIYLKHILDEANYIIDHSSSIEYDDFINDETLKRSFARSIEIIGEAIKKLPDDLRDSHNTIPWKNIAGMRDILIHEYFGVSFKLVWDVVKNKIPELKTEIMIMLSEDQS